MARGGKVTVLDGRLPNIQKLAGKMRSSRMFTSVTRILHAQRNREKVLPKKGDRVRVEAARRSSKTPGLGTLRYGSKLWRLT